MNVLRRIDDAFTGPGPARTLVQMRALLAGVIGLRLVFRNWWLVSTTPDALFEPVAAISWLSRPPESWLVTLLVVVGVGGVIATIVGRGAHLGFVLAWLSLVVQGAAWSSSGKVMHNDILLIWAAFPMLFAPSPRRDDLDTHDVRWGWPPRAVLIAIAAVYFLAGFQKLNHSGLTWVFSDNLSWVLRQGHGVLPESLVQTMADQTWLTAAIAGLTLVMELGAPVLLAFAKLRPVFLALAVALHGSIFLTLGLDYYGWVLTVAAATIPMSPTFHRFPIMRRAAPSVVGHETAVP